MYSSAQIDTYIEYGEIATYKSAKETAFLKIRKNIDVSKHTRLIYMIRQSLDWAENYYTGTAGLDKVANYLYTLTNKYIGNYTTGGQIAYPETSGNNCIKPETYTATTDGETYADVPTLIGYDIVWVNKEIMPLTKNQYSWNKLTGRITLIGTTLAAGERLFLLGAKCGSSSGAEITITGTSTYSIPAGKLLTSIVFIKPTTTSIAVGTTSGGTDISDYTDTETLTVNDYLDTDTTLYFSGVLADTTIKIYIE